jgi:hypothetical protein
LDQLGKELERAVVGRFGAGWEGAGRQLAHLQVILDALAAESLARAGGIGTVAVGQIAFLLTIHQLLLKLGPFLSILDELGEIG